MRIDHKKQRNVRIDDATWDALQRTAKASGHESRAKVIRDEQRFNHPESYTDNTQEEN